MYLVWKEEKYSLFFKASASLKETSLKSCDRAYGCVIFTSVIH